MRMDVDARVRVFVMRECAYIRRHHAKLACARSLQAHERDPTSSSTCIMRAHISNMQQCCNDQIYHG